MALVPVASPDGGAAPGALAPAVFKTLGTDFFGAPVQRRASYTARQAEMRTHADRMKEPVAAARCCKRECIATVLREDGAALEAWRQQWGELLAPQREEALLQHMMASATRGVRAPMFNDPPCPPCPTPAVLATPADDDRASEALLDRDHRSGCDGIASYSPSPLLR